jgi:hypothetical protein
MIGQDIAESSLGDDNIIALLHHLKQPTLFTRDEHFYEKRLGHRGYCLAWLDVAPEETAFFICRFLNHSRFETKSQRMGCVVRLHQEGIHFWELNRVAPQQLSWPEKADRRRARGPNGLSVRPSSL